jgi:TonB family protein
MIGLILTGLLKANLAAGAGVLVVLALRTLMRPRFGAGAAYLMWLAPLAAGLAVLAPHPVARTPIAPMAPIAMAMEAFVATAPASVGGGPDLASLAFGVWIAGALAAAALLLRRQAMFLRAMGRLEAVGGSGVFRAERSGVGPAVVGVLRPRIVAPADFETRFGPKERELILAHEGVHLRRGDWAVNALACAAQCLCWFNPLVHLAAHLLRIDQELACDATVIDRFPAERRTYAELLLKTQLATQALPLGCHWPAGSAHPLKARIAMLKSPFPERAMRAMGVAVVASVTLGAGALAWSAQPSPVVKPTAPVADTPAPPVIPPLAVLPSQDPRPLHAPPRAAKAVRVSVADAPQEPAAPAAPPVIVKPDWVVKPTPADLADVYPPEAVKAGLGGAATIACAVSVEGRLADCKVIDEAPVQAGFGAAALKLAERFQMKPMSRDGQPVSGGKIRIPIRFALPRAPQPVTPS